MPISNNELNIYLLPRPCDSYVAYAFNKIMCKRANFYVLKSATSLNITIYLSESNENVRLQEIEKVLLNINARKVQ